MGTLYKRRYYEGSGLSIYEVIKVHTYVGKDSIEVHIHTECVTCNSCWRTNEYSNNHFLACYTKDLLGLHLVRALDEDTSFLLLHWARQLFLGIPSVTLGILVFFLIFCESFSAWPCLLLLLSFTSLHLPWEHRCWCNSKLIMLIISLKRYFYQIRQPVLNPISSACIRLLSNLRTYLPQRVSKWAYMQSHISCISSMF